MTKQELQKKLDDLRKEAIELGKAGQYDLVARALSSIEILEWTLKKLKEAK